MDIYIDMTKTQLKRLIKECLCEIDFAPGFRPTKDLTVVSTATGSDVDSLKKYVLELHKTLTTEFDKDIQFDQNLNMSILPNKDKKIDTTFTITNIEDDVDLMIVKQNLQLIYEELTTWSIQQDLVIDFTFKIKK